MEASPAQPQIRLRPVAPADLPYFFANQQDPVAVQMAAFTPRHPYDLNAFHDHWERIQSDDTIVIRSIEATGNVAGHVLVHHSHGKPELSYWLAREYWGKRIGSRAVAAFIAADCPMRPLFAHAAADNSRSLSVLRNNGFVEIERRLAFANGRGEEIEEIVTRLD